MRSITDAYGRVIVTFEDLPEALYAGVKVADLLVEPCSGVDKFNVLCREFDQPDRVLRHAKTPDCTPEEEHARRSNTWLIPDDLRDIDLRGFLVSMCKNEVEIARVHEEMDLFEARGLEPLLRAMLYLVDHWQSHKVLWGVGRGSSVASFCLYLIGVHRINPLRYNLSIHEFLKPED